MPQTPAMLNFNKQGLLVPPGPIIVGMEEVKKVLVDEMLTTERSGLFENYLAYLAELQTVIGGGFFQWMDGSFVTKKKNPGDIDVVNFVHYSIVDENIEKLKALKFPESLEKYAVDAYIVRVYEEGHRFRALYLGDRAEWWHHFESTKIFKNGKSIKKGFLQIEL